MMHALMVVATSIGIIVLVLWAACVLVLILATIRTAYHSYIRLTRFISVLTAEQKAKATLAEKVKWWFKDIFNSYDHIQLNGHRIYRNINTPIDGGPVRYPA